jgi:hypothetical protein
MIGLLDKANAHPLQLSGGLGKDLEGRPTNAVARGEPGPYGGTPKLYTTYVYVRAC